MYGILCFFNFTPVDIKLRSVVTDEKKEAEHAKRVGKDWQPKNKPPGSILIIKFLLFFSFFILR